MARSQLMTDSFTYTNQELQATANWDFINDSNHTPNDVLTNQFASLYGFDSVDVWVGANAGSITADSYASVVVSGIGSQSGDRIGAVARALVGTGAADADYYRAQYLEGAVNHELSLWKYVNGTLTQLGSTVTSVTVANSDRIAIKCVGTNITLEHNETPVSGLTDISDSALSSAGAVGVYGRQGALGTLRGDSFDAGNITADGGGAHVRLSLLGVG